MCFFLLLLEEYSSTPELLDEACPATTGCGYIVSYCVDESNNNTNNNTSIHTHVVSYSRLQGPRGNSTTIRILIFFTQQQQTLFWHFSPLNKYQSHPSVVSCPLGASAPINPFGTWLRIHNNSGLFWQPVSAVHGLCHSYDTAPQCLFLNGFGSSHQLEQLFCPPPLPPTRYVPSFICVANDNPADSSLVNSLRSSSVWIHTSHARRVLCVGLIGKGRNPAAGLETAVAFDLLAE